MFAFQVCGSSNTGKSTLIAGLIPFFLRDNKSICVVKDIHAGDFEMDTAGKDTYWFKKKGAGMVVARGPAETDIYLNKSMKLEEIVPFISAEWLIIEGMREAALPRIVCGKTQEDVDSYLDDRTFLISGPFSRTRTTYGGLPVRGNEGAEESAFIYEKIVSVVFPLLPLTDCGACGMTCSEFTTAVISGKKSRTDCFPPPPSVLVRIGSAEIPLNPFVQKIMKNTVLSILRELKGWKEGHTVRIDIRPG